MKITEHIEQAKGKCLFSFEILPPLKGQTIQSIFDAIDPLMEFKPPFIDVTYHREEYDFHELPNGLLEKKSGAQTTRHGGNLRRHSKPLRRRCGTPHTLWRIYQRRHRKFSY